MKGTTQMKCPNCNHAALVMSERQGIEIDYCPDCRGIWLDRGELDKLLEKASANPSGAASVASQPIHQAKHATEKVVYVGDSHYHHRRHKSWLSDIFD
jgi:Zn-finger nucleic acid-binding protein